MPLYSALLAREHRRWWWYSSQYLLSDTFNRADNASSLGTADTGQSYTVAGSLTWGVQSGHAYAPTISASGIATADAGQADVDVTCSLVLRSTQDQSRGFLLARSDGTLSNKWAVGCDNAGSTLILSKSVSGTGTNVATTAFSVTLGGTYTLRIVAKLSAWTVYVNGVQTLTATDSDLSTLTRCGFQAVRGGGATGSPFFNNFHVSKAA